MNATHSLPPAVEHRLRAYHTLLEREPTLRIDGLYLVGSVALGDYHDGISDIDFVALLPDLPGPEATDRLRGLHATLAQAGGPSLDGLYLCLDHLRTPPAAPAIVPRSLDGALIADRPCQEFGPVTWRCLARSGVTVLGKPPSDLGIADDSGLLRRSQIENLQTYWTSWIAQCETDLAAKPAGTDANALALAWGVLGVARIAHTLETGRIVSKSEAGRWAMAAWPAAWHPILREALMARTGAVARVPLDRVRAGLSFMRLVIGEATGYQAPSTASPDGRP